MPFREQLLTLFPALTRIPHGGYVVGGAVRDLLLGREPADVDVACLDPLSFAKAVRNKVIRLGDEEHLSAYRVVKDERVYDFAALLDDNIDSDLARRDFTINAMALDLDRDALLDPHDGQRDLASRIVRMVRDTNFDDDPLRTLKGVRMAIRFGFTMDPATVDAIRTRAHRILDIATERVTYELSIIFGARAFRRALALLRETGLDAPLELATREFLADDVTLAGAYALLVRDPRAYAERWKWSDQLLHEVLTLQRLLDQHDRIALFDAGEWVAHQLAPMLRALGRDANLDLPDFSIRALLSGGEIAEVTGLQPGKELGQIKRAMLEKQVRGELATREDAVAWVTSRDRHVLPTTDN